MLFDLDGTLSNSEPGILKSLDAALALVGLQFSREAMRHTIGPPFDIGLPALGVPAEHLPAVIGRYREHYEEAGLFDTSVYDGVVDMLDALAEGGYVLAVATSKPETSARRVLDHLELTSRFAAIAGATYGPERANKSAVIAHALEQLARRGGPDVVMVGDRQHDIEGARHHDIDTIAVTWGYGGPDEFRKFGAWAVADRPADVVELIVGSAQST
ncbi:HAD family hydrolase [soil metagenome]